MRELVDLEREQRRGDQQRQVLGPAPLRATGRRPRRPPRRRRRGSRRRRARPARTAARRRDRCRPAARCARARRRRWRRRAGRRARGRRARAARRDARRTRAMPKPSAARTTQWNARSTAIARTTILSRSGRPRAGSVISRTLRRMPPARRRRGGDDRPRVAAQAAMPARTAVLAGHDSVLRAQLLRVGADELMAHQPTHQELPDRAASAHARTVPRRPGATGLVARRAADYALAVSAPCIRPSPIPAAGMLVALALTGTPAAALGPGGWPARRRPRG